MAGRLRRQRRDENELMSRINVTPMVDVMLVLLIIFMITSPMLVSGVHVDLPKESTAPVVGQDEPLSVSINREGTVFLEDNQILLDDLVPKLDAIAGQNHETRIFVRGDKAIDYGKVMKVVSAISAAGYSKVALITDPNS